MENMNASKALALVAIGCFIKAGYHLAKMTFICFVAVADIFLTFAIPFVKRQLTRLAHWLAHRNSR